MAVNLFYIFSLSLVFPLVGAFWNKSAVWVGVGLSLAAFVGGIWVAEESTLQVFLLSQIPALGVVSVLSFYFSKIHGADSIDAETSQHKISLEKMRNRHAELKKSVFIKEKGETRSLQIYGIAKALAQALSWKDMAPPLTAAIQKTFDTFEFLLYGIDEDGTWTPIHRRGSWTREPPITGTLGPDPFFTFPPQSMEVLPVLTIPILRPDAEGIQIKGVLYLKTHPDVDQQELIGLAREFGAQLDMGLNKALLFTQMENHSRLDGLTGLLRRQVFMDRLGGEIKKAMAFNTQFCVLMVDLDHFKSINDSHGHAAGDEVLRRVGALLKESFYETDVVGRYGGEEFIVLLPRAQKEGVIRKAENLRHRIEEEVISVGFEQIRMTVSIGLSQFPVNGRTMESLVESADQALYRAKESGRNRVIAA